MSSQNKSETAEMNKQLLPQIIYVEKGTGRYIYSVFHIMMSLVAIYLSFRCNTGFHLGSFIVALCCPYIYIVYILATRGTCGILENQ
jgi:hypothetical protein